MGAAENNGRGNTPGRTRRSGSGHSHRHDDGAVSVIPLHAHHPGFRWFGEFHGEPFSRLQYADDIRQIAPVECHGHTRSLVLDGEFFRPFSYVKGMDGEFEFSRPHL